MGSFCSIAHGHFNQTETMESTKCKEQLDSTVSAEGESRIVNQEPDLSPSKVVPSYSWLVASPVDLDATTTGKTIRKAKQSVKSRSESGKRSSVKYCNAKYLCQLSVTGPPQLNTKHCLTDQSSDSSSTSSHSHAIPDSARRLSKDIERKRKQP